MMSGTSEPTTVTIEETYEFLWKIPNWDVIRNDRELRSQQKFVINTTGCGCDLGSKWIGGIKNYPEEDEEDDDEDDDEEYGIYCKLVEVASPGSKMEVRFVAELRKSNAFGGGAYWTDEHYGNVTVGHCFEVEERWNPDLNWTEFLDEGTNAATIYIKLIVLNPVTPLEGAKEAQETKFRLACDGVAELSLATLLESNFSEPDLKIVCSDGKELKCHKTILQKSPVFEKMLDPESEFTESSTGIINVKDVGSQSMKLVLHYLYTGNLLATWKDPEVIVEFTYAANKYGLVKVLDYLDNTLGVPEVGETPSVQHLLVLLDVAIQLELKKAESKIRKELMRLVVSKLADCKSSTEMVEFFGGDK